MKGLDLGPNHCVGSSWGSLWDSDQCWGLSCEEDLLGHLQGVAGADHVRQGQGAQGLGGD